MKLSLLFLIIICLSTTTIFAGGTETKSVKHKGFRLSVTKNPKDGTILIKKEKKDEKDNQDANEESEDNSDNSKNDECHDSGCSTFK